MIVSHVALENEWNRNEILQTAKNLRKGKELMVISFLKNILPIWIFLAHLSQKRHEEKFTLSC